MKYRRQSPEYDPDWLMWGFVLLLDYLAIVWVLINLLTR
jgi:hypothetical protein